MEVVQFLEDVDEYKRPIPPVSKVKFVKLLCAIIQNREEIGSIGKLVPGLPKGEAKSAKISRMKELQTANKGHTKVVRRYLITNSEHEEIVPFCFEEWADSPSSTREWIQPGRGPWDLGHGL